MIGCLSEDPILQWAHLRNDMRQWMGHVWVVHRGSPLKGHHSEGMSSLWRRMVACACTCLITSQALLGRCIFYLKGAGEGNMRRKPTSSHGAGSHGDKEPACLLNVKESMGRACQPKQELGDGRYVLDGYYYSTVTTLAWGRWRWVWKCQPTAATNHKLRLPAFP